ncbi:MAG TPA: lipase family protein, partial [Prosthecobacter sp.]|nr:lipase family protein [Prosthecobacter sp.]
EECRRVRFAPHATDCHLPNAWWLAEASFAAYETFPTTAWSIDLSPLLEAEYQIRPTAAGGTQFLAVENEEVLIVAFRGTRLEEMVVPFLKAPGVAPNWADVAIDARFLPKKIAPDVFVHQGFHEAYLAIDAPFADLVTAAARDDKPVWLTGHSLGGALATLAAYHHQKKIHGLYTFGSPRVGNAGFVKSLSEGLTNIWRFVHHRDVIPALPPEGPPGTRRYVHAGRAKWISGRQTWNIEDGGSALNTVSALAADALAHAQEVGRTVARNFSLTDPKSWPITMEALADHSPMYYANKIFNAHEASLGR